MSADSIEKIADLLPCPFCGAAPLKTTTHRVFCANAACCLASKDWDCWPDQWNRRALPSLAELERDAARWRWLDAQTDNTWDILSRKSITETREYIDNAIARAKEAKRQEVGR